MFDNRRTFKWKLEKGSIMEMQQGIEYLVIYSDDGEEGHNGRSKVLTYCGSNETHYFFTNPRKGDITEGLLRSRVIRFEEIPQRDN